METVKKGAGLLLLVVCAAAMFGQAQPEADAALAAMKKLDFLHGDWQGESWVETRGTRRELMGMENVDWKLGRKLLLIEGVHRDKMSGKIDHNAVTIITWDSSLKQYRVRAYQADGSTVDAEGKLVDGRFEWGFRAPQGRIRVRYVIALDAMGRWKETGEVSPDGATWNKFYEMTLERTR